MRLKSFFSDDVVNRRVLVRVDFNVPFNGDKISDTTRILAHIPTMKALLYSGAKVALISHLGRPMGQVNMKYTLAPVAEELAKMTGWAVKFVPDCIGGEVDKAVASWRSNEILLLENVRFHPEEEKNDKEFADKLAKNFDVFVMDAFSVAHRAHASTSALAAALPSYAGKLLIKEVDMLSAARDDPKNPYVLILGGTKVSDKINVVENMIDKVDAILIGGGMAFTFLKAKGFEIGKSLCENDKVSFAKEMLKKARLQGVRIVLPSDVIAADKLDAEARAEVYPSEGIPEDKMGLDIGPQTTADFAYDIYLAKTVLWNGPVGVFEIPAFSRGTEFISKALVKATEGGALTIVGGGDSAAAIKLFHCGDRVSHVSTGGGASLEFFEGKILPGLEPYIINKVK